MPETKAKTRPKSTYTCVKCGFVTDALMRFVAHTISHK